MTDTTSTSSDISSSGADKRARNRFYIRLWLYFICVLIFAMILVGGATRLTDSGLSITEWLPLLGAIPPITEADWLVVFEKYKLIPEYSEINKDMSLAEFKFIYWWEWAHRFLGRFIGVAFFLPLVWFWVTKRIEPGLKPKLVVIFLLGAFQGGIGWWMVASGLVERVDVSQYRLATHLIVACFIFIACQWVALGLSDSAWSPRHVPLLRYGAGLVLVLVVVQIYLGALVAGLHAGLTYNTWPLMDGDLIPGGMGSLEPGWRNLFENITTVQFVHRTAAYLVFIAALWHLWTVVRNAPRSRMAASVKMLVTVILVQVGLGIWTLLAVVPISLALIHQGGAVVVMAVAVWNLHRGGRRLVEG